MLQKLKISFNEEQHRYVADNGIVVPSVSTIIESGKHFAMIPKDVQHAVMYRGTVLHQNINYFIETGDTMGDALLASFSEIYEILVKKYGKYKIGEEALGASYEGMAFGGKPDIVLEGAIVEIKSSLGSAERLYSMQLAAYSMLCEANDITKADTYIICYKNKNGFAYKVLPNTYAGMTPQEAFILALRKHYMSAKIKEYEDNLSKYINSL